MTDLMARVEERLGEVGARLTAATGGQALCRLDGHQASAKELEGRMAMLLEIRRAPRSNQHFDLELVAERWRTDLAARQAQGASAAWVSYLTGGLSEVELLTR